MNYEDVRALKEYGKSTPRRILSGILSKNSENYEIKQKFKL